MYLYGIGGIGVVVIELLAELGISVTGYYDDSGAHDMFNGLPVQPGLGSSLLSLEDIAAKAPLICIGDNVRRKELVQLLNPKCSSLVHPTAIVSPSATIGSCSMIFHRGCVQAGAILGAGVIMNTGASVDHDCIIGDYTHIAPNTTLCGGVKVGEGANIGAGSVVIPNITIGAWSVIGAGSVVIRDVPAFATVVGNPTRVIRVQDD